MNKTIATDYFYQDQTEKGNFFIKHLPFKTFKTFHVFCDMKQKSTVALSYLFQRIFFTERCFVVHDFLWRHQQLCFMVIIIAIRIVTVWYQRPAKNLRQHIINAKGV